MSAGGSALALPATERGRADTEGAVRSHRARRPTLTTGPTSDRDHRAPRRRAPRGPRRRATTSGDRPNEARRHRRPAGAGVSCRRHRVGSSRASARMPVGQRRRLVGADDHLDRLGRRPASKKSRASPAEAGAATGSGSMQAPITSAKSAPTWLRMISGSRRSIVSGAPLPVRQNHASAPREKTSLASRRRQPLAHLGCDEARRCRRPGASGGLPAQAGRAEVEQQGLGRRR